MQNHFEIISWLSRPWLNSYLIKIHNSRVQFLSYFHFSVTICILFHDSFKSVTHLHSTFFRQNKKKKAKKIQKLGQWLNSCMLALSTKIIPTGSFSAFSNWFLTRGVSGKKRLAIRVRLLSSVPWQSLPYYILVFKISTVPNFKNLASFSRFQQ